MATFVEETKNTTTLTNQTPSPKDTNGLTLADYSNATLADGGGTLGNPKTPYDKQTKNTTDLENETKN